MKKKGAASAARLACALAGAIIVIAGCHKVTGGGWITGVNGGKATFGFQAQCKPGEPSDFGPALDFFVGQFQYHDKGAKVSFHGDVIANNFALGFPGSCRDLGELIAENAEVLEQFGFSTKEAEFTGECVSRPGDVQGTFKVVIVDNGKPGPDPSDEITVATPNFFVQDILECTKFNDEGWCEEFEKIGEEVVTLGLPCTADGQAYSNSGVLRGGNIVMPGHTDAGSGAKKKG
jgi:hypothetical protein